MKSIALIIILSMLSLPAHAEVWFCVAEYIAFVTDKDGKVTDAGSGLNNSKFLVDERGVHEFGVDAAILDKCIWHEGRPTSCEWSGQNYGGYFSMNKENVFTLAYIKGDTDDTISDIIVKGKCSRISD